MIKKLDVKNYIGIRNVELDLAPVTLFCGHNGAGKSSLAQAIRHAMVGEWERVSHKKDFQGLLHTGASAGHALVTTDAGEYGVLLPDGKQVGGQPHFALPFCLKPELFAAMDDNERRTFLLKLAGVQITPDAIASRLTERGTPADLVDAIRPHLSSGFEAAAKEASAKARDAKAAWRTVTGETYGEKKAETWAAVYAVEVVAQVVNKISMEEIDAQIEAASANHGALLQRKRDADSRAGNIAALQEKASRYARIQDKLNRDTADRDAWLAKVKETEQKAAGDDPLTCPHCAGMVVSKLGALVPFDGAMPDHEAATKLPEYRRALALMESAVSNGKRDLAEADAAAEALKQFDAASEAPPIDEEIQEARQRLDELKNLRRTAQSEIQALRDAEKLEADAKRKTAAAADLHADVLAWSAVADLLSPDGIPSELIDEALEPFNAVLMAHSERSSWPMVAIETDMGITVGGRGYAMRSESEQWRADAMMAAAIAEISGCRVLILDRLDVLDLAGRSDAIGWLDSVRGAIDTAIVLGTLKAAPRSLLDGMQAFWIENGEVV